MIIKIAIMGICVCILNSLFNQHGKTYQLFLNLIFALIIMGMVFREITPDFNGFIKLISVNSTTKKLYVCLLKGAVICIVTKISCDISRDSGNILISDIVDIAGRFMLFAVSLPFIESIVKTAFSFIK